MKLEELKKLREEKFLAHKKKKREYYLKKKEVKTERAASVSSVYLIR